MSIYLAESTLTSDLIAFVSLNNDEFKTEATSLLESKKYSLLITKILEIDQLFANPDVESIFHILSTLLSKIENPSAIIESMCESIYNGNILLNPPQGLKILANLYNSTPETSSDRCSIATKFITYSSKSNQVNSCKAFLSNMGTTIESFKCTIEKKRILCLAIADALKVINSKEQELLFLIKYLSTFESISIENKSSVIEIARRAILTACENPLFFAHRDSLLSLSAILKLKDDAELKPAYELLKIVCSDNYEAFLTFEKNNSSFISTCGLSKDQLIESMKLLSLCSLAIVNEEVSYAKVALALHIEEKDVEYWVVLAITRNLIEARMDQLAKVVFMTRSRRMFDSTQWKSLSLRLHEWKSGVKKVIDSIKSKENIN